jgi:hypothetical protein
MGRFISHQDRKSGTTGNATIIARSARQHKRISRYLGVYLRRQRSRLGAPKAITAAHKLARIVCNLMRYGLAYAQVMEAVYAALVREWQLQRRARELGYEVKKREPVTAAVEKAEAAWGISGASWLGEALGSSRCEPGIGENGSGEEGIGSNGASGARRVAHPTTKTIPPPSHSQR